MNPTPNYSEFQQLFSVNGMSFLMSELFMGHYRKLDGLTVFAHDQWTSFLPKSTIEKTLEDGLERFSSEVVFQEFKSAISDYYLRSAKFFEEILAHADLSENDTRAFLDLMIENFTHYSKTEFFYVDKAFQMSENNPVIQKNLKEFEEIKNAGRLNMNKVFFTPDSYRRQFMKKIAAQFSLEKDTIASYKASDILNLFKGIKIKPEIIADRERSYVMYGKDAETHYFQGEESEKIVDNFFDGQKVDSKLTQLKGIVANKGKVTAQVSVIKFGNKMFERLAQVIDDMPQGSVLVSDTTSPELFMACKKASAILTNQGGMMSHAAIVSRELNIPCIVGLKIATQVLKDGDMVEVDAEKGIVTIIK